MSQLISCQNISFSYPVQEENVEKAVFEHLDFTVKKGEFTAVLGHNGSGKSTLAKMFNAILLPTEGDVFINGTNTKQEDDLYTIRSQVGMVFQNPDNQIVASVVEEDVAFGLENMGVAPEEIRKRVDDALKAVDMYEYRLSAPYQLSGGQKQRVAIAGIIAMMPDCIVLDEPTAMLDPQGRKEVMSTLKMLNQDFGITILLITHYMDEAAQCGRVVVMDAGKIILDDSPEEVFSQVDLLHQVGLDVPQSSELIWELTQRGVTLPNGIITPQRCVEVLEPLLNQVVNHG